MLRLLITCYCYSMLVSRSVQVAPFRASLWKPTEEQPCKSGRYASITSRNTTKCRYCSLCPKGQQVNTDCGTHSNTVCEDCPSESFNDVRGGTCRECSRCKPGTYVRSYCSKTHDTRCRPCPKRRFNTVWNTEACEQCSRCKTHEKFIARCQKNRDTQCGDCLHGYFRESFTGNCLRCSPCPYYDLRRYVVNECQTRLGIEHSDVCWPGVFTGTLDNRVQIHVNGYFVNVYGNLIAHSHVSIFNDPSEDYVTATTCINIGIYSIQTKFMF